MVLSPFSGSTGPKKSKKVDFDPKTVNFGVILAEISACGRPARPKNFSGVKNTIFCSQKNFHGAKLILGLHSPEKVQKWSILGEKR